MEFLKGILGDELYGQLEAKLQEHNTAEGNKDKQVKLVNVNTGEYISKEKYLTLKTQSDGLDGQLKTANAEIKSYKDMDIDGIKTKAAEWEHKYTADTTALQEKMNRQAYDFEAERYLGKFKFSSDLAKKAALAEFKDKAFQLQDGAFLGAEDYMKQMKEANPAAFVEDAPPNQNQNQSQQGRFQAFVRGTSGSYQPPKTGEEKAILDQKYANNPYYHK